MQSLLELLNLIAEGWAELVILQEDEELAGIRINRDEININLTKVPKHLKGKEKKKAGIKNLAQIPKIREKLVMLEQVGKKFGAQNKFLVIRVRNKEALRLGMVKSILSLLGFKHVKITPAAIRFFMP